MWRWLTLSIILHTIFLLILSDFMPLTATGTQQARFAGIDAVLQHSLELSTKKVSGTAVKDKLKHVAPKVGMPAIKAEKPIIKNYLPAMSESGALLPALPNQINQTGSELSSGDQKMMPQQAVSIDGLNEYRLNLSREARRYKRYPTFARQYGLEGVVVVVVKSNATLSEPQVSVSRSSGQVVLDQQAMQMLGLAARAVSLPESLRHRDFAIELPVHFSLDE